MANIQVLTSITNLLPDPVFTPLTSGGGLGETRGDLRGNCVSTITVVLVSHPPDANFFQQGNCGRYLITIDKVE